ncbi:hypothetical protein [Paenibacillus sedimenti]|uniref:Uncharacterized protein n=1 Tax=Paenibacillus sedimenti TaxID=2770274 RepID=A0A926KWH1_9BACL|nr:hypothetical protein [Paenibacillus sedimenti]MBD0384436.1 hypothetical protein [Paenibacillus sedimenti]
MIAMKYLIKCFYVAETCILLILTGCTGSNPVKDRPHIMTPNWSNYRGINEGTKDDGLHTLGLENDHLSTTLAFHPEIAESILSQYPGIQSTYVFFTKENCYIAFVPNELNPTLKASQEKIFHRVDKKGATSYFEKPDMINRVDWISQSRNMPTRSLEAIGRDAEKYMPTYIKRIYVSANPNFVNCLRFYSQEVEEHGDLSMYLNEFNKIVERVFPD